VTVYVGIDQSFGGLAVAIYRPDFSGASRVQRRAFSAAKFGKGVDRLITVEDWIHLIFTVNNLHDKVTHVAMEGYARNAKSRREESGEISYAVRRALRKALSPPVCYPTIVAPTKVKKFATGKGNADKEAVKKAVYEKWGQKFDDDNEADAFVIAKIAEAVHLGTAALPYEREVIHDLLPHTDMPKAA